LDAFFAGLTAFDAPGVFNPWRQADALDVEVAPLAALARLVRLKFHFDCAPDFLLIGEAPGYQGCHFSGVPFANESPTPMAAFPRLGATPLVIRPHRAQRSRSHSADCCTSVDKP
jgi:hypothetical protein